MSDPTFSNILVIIVFLLLIATVIYGITRIDKESFDCVYDPIGYYEEINNVTIPRMIKHDVGIDIVSFNFTEFRP